MATTPEADADADADAEVAPEEVGITSELAVIFGPEAVMETSAVVTGDSTAVTVASAQARFAPGMALNDVRE